MEQQVDYIKTIEYAYQYIDHDQLSLAHDTMNSIAFQHIQEMGHDSPVGDYFYLAGYLSAIHSPIDNSMLPTIGDYLSTGYPDVLNTLNQLPEPLFEALHGFIFGLIKKTEAADGVIYAPTTIF